MREEDIIQVTRIYLQCFKGMQEFKLAKKWITLHHNSFPASQYFVATLNKKILGYIQWIELGGFRKNAVLELEQIAVSPDHQGQGIGEKLVKESLKQVSSDLHRRKSSIKLIKVTTATAFETEEFYKRVLKVKRVAVIPDFFRSDEAILIARKKEISDLI